MGEEAGKSGHQLFYTLIKNGVFSQLSSVLTLRFVVLLVERSVIDPREARSPVIDYRPHTASLV